MKIKLHFLRVLLTLMIIFDGSFLMAQQKQGDQNLATYYSTDFESFTLGGQVACQNSTNWSTWSNAACGPEDGTISNTFAQSGTKSVKIENTTDLLLLLGNRTSGKCELSWNMYIENETGGYYNIQHTQTNVGTDVALDIYFFQNGTGELTAGGIPTAFTYPKAAWFPVRHVIDLDLDIIQLYINNELVSEWPFSYQSSSTTAGAKQLGAIDFFAGATGTEIPRYYFDDVLLKDYEAAPVYTNDMSVQSIVKPVTGYSMTGSEIVIVKVKNNYTAPLSNIPVSYQINGGAVVNEIIPGPLAAGAVLNYSFSQLADLSVVGDHTVVATVSFPGDENAANNSLTKVVSNLGNVITMQNGTFNSCDGAFYDSGSGTATYQPSENYTLTILPSIPGGKIKFDFTLFDTENNYDFLKVYDGIDITAPLIGTFSGPAVPAALQNLVASDNNSSGGITFNFTSDGSSQGAGWVASVSCIAPLEHDLAAISVAGTSNPVINSTVNYTVTVSNAGLMPELGSSYVVKLFDAYDGQIGVTNGIDIGFQGTQDFVFTWTPQVEGPAFVYGKVELVGDLNPANDRSAHFAVSVMPTGQTNVQIGTGIETSYSTPLNMFFNYSFSQTLYLQSELNIPNKRIFRIGYQYAGTTPVINNNIEVYLSHSSATELTASVPLTNFTKVYDGPWVCQAGDDFSYIDILPFYYNNTDNLIVTIIEKKPGYTSSADVFKVTSTLADQHLSISAQNDGAAYDPNNLPVGNQLTVRPNTKLFMGDIPANPACNTSPGTLNFGQVEMTQTNTMQVNVTNVGGGTMEITGATFSNNNYTLANAAFPVSLAIGQHHTFDIVFAPTAVGLEQGTITFIMDASIPGSKSVQVTGRGLRFGVLRESFEGELFPPLSWKVVDANNDSKGWLRNTGFVPTGQTAAHIGIAAASLDVYVGNPGQISSDDWLITPNMKWQDGDMVSFWIKRVADQAGQVWRVGYSTTGTDPGSFTIIDEITDPPLSYTEKSYNMSEHGLVNGDNYFIGIQFNGKWCWPGVIDDVMGSVVNRFDNDLMVMDFKTTNDIFYANAASNFTAKIGNPGVNPVADGAYTVNVAANVNGVETIFYTANGPAIGVGEAKALVLPVVMPQTGVYSLYFKIVWAADQDLTNNQSDIIPVEVIANSVVVKNIGDFPIPIDASYYKYIPLNFEDYRKTSLTQSMYFVNELNTGGIIERLSYYKNFNGDMSQCKIKVWMSETTNTALDTYIAPSKQKLVFDGRVDFAAGIGRANIELTQPFIYTGSGNLVVTVYYYAGSSSSDNKYFAYKDGGYPNRTIKEYGYSTIDPETPAFVAANTEFPFTSLRFETGNGLAQVTGTVLYQVGNAPVDSAQVRISNPDYPGTDAIISTNAQGIYTAPYAMAGSNLKITISKYGYTDVVYNNVNLANGGNINLGTAYLVERPHISLNGTVIKSDTQTPAASAIVKLTGMADYETTTNADGTFTLPNIWGSTTYQIEVSLDGYQSYNADVIAPAVDFVLDPITILENAPAPNLVNAVNVQDNALVTWYAAGQPYPMNYRYDDGTVTGVLITTGDPNIIGGSAWRNNAVVQSVQWYTYEWEGGSPSTEVKITILGLNADASPNPADVLFTQEHVINNYGWNTLTLPTSIAAPNGFFVGTSGYNNYTLIAYDDGVGEPYEWSPRTQWSNGMGAYYALETVTSPGLFGNIFVRASGLSTGNKALADVPADSHSVVDMKGGTPSFICMPVTPFYAGQPKTNVSYTKAADQKSFEHYNVYRKAISETAWLQVSAAPVSDTSFTDTGYASLSYGLYHYGVEAEYTNGVKSVKAISNVLEKNMRLSLELIVNTNTSVAGVSAGAAVILTNNDGNANYIYHAVVGAAGTVTIENVMKGLYSLSIIHTGFENYAEANIDLNIEGNLLQKTVILTERISDPYDLEVMLEGQTAGTAKFVWNQPPVFDNVNSYQPFLISNIGNWKVIDVDNSPTTYPQGVSYPNMGEASSFMTLDRSLTTPPLSEAYWGGYSGNQYFASFGSATGVTNNWLISEKQNHSLPYSLSFYAKSITETYGLETFRIGYSVSGDNISDFIFITGNLEASTNWTKFSYIIPAEAKYIAIRHTHTGFALLVDDITIGVETDGAIPGNGFTAYLDNSEVATGLMTPEYTFTGVAQGSHTAGVKSNFYSGASLTKEVNFILPESSLVSFDVKGQDGLFIDGAEVEIQLNNVAIASALTINGLVSFPMYPGTYSYSVSKTGYNTFSAPMVVGAVPLNINVVLSNFFTLTFAVKNTNGEPVSNANVIFKNVTKLTNSEGITSFVTVSGYSTYAVTHESYGNVLGGITILTDTTINVVMPPMSCEAPAGLAYTLEQNKVTLAWTKPETGASGEWLHWDGDHGNSIGTGGVVDFDVAQRFLPADLVQYNGKYLTRVMFSPFEAACTYSIRVWTGGNISHPESLVVDQLVSNPVIGQWNEVFLEIPVQIDATKELWIGFRNNATTGHPAGTDVGPAINGKGNMINLAGGGWQTLLQVAPTLSYNWSVRGLVEDVNAPLSPIQILADDNDRGEFNGSLSVVEGNTSKGFDDPRVLLGYNVYRNAVKVNQNPVTNTSYIDFNLPINTYEYRVTSIYSNACESDYSNSVMVEVTDMPCLTPVDLTAVANAIDPNLVQLEWSLPHSTEFRYDDGTRVGNLGFTNGTINGVVGAKHTTSAKLSEISWLLSDDVNGGGPHATVQLYVFGLTATGMPNGSNMLYTAMVTNTDGIWNTHVLDTPVMAEGGFFIGVGYDGFVGLGTDDGLTAPYVYQPGTHYFSSDFTTGNWTAWESSGFSVNGLIRAVGVPGAVKSYPVVQGIVAESDIALIPAAIAHETGAPEWRSLMDDNKDNLLGYNIYKSGLLLDSLWQKTIYTDSTPNMGQNCYTVKAKYIDCGETGPSNEACILYVGVDKTDIQGIKIYPNPAKGSFTIESPGLKRVTIVNSFSQVVYDREMNSQQSFIVNSASLSSGMYFIRLITSEGITTRRISIVR